MNRKVINIGLIGFGKVGAGVVKILQDSKKFIGEKIGSPVVLKRIADLDIRTSRGVKVASGVLTADSNLVISYPGIDMVVELTGSESAGKKLILKALSKGKHVVTANKAAVAGSWDEIFSAAGRNKAGFYFEASVGAGIPVIQAIREGLAANRISQIFGIVNGITNYILTQMARSGRTFDGALSEAKKKGFAEPDPTLDINGSDSMHKIAILSSLAFGSVVRPGDISVEGIEKIDPDDIRYGKEFGYTLKLLAVAKRTDGSVEVRVHPTFLPDSHLLSSVENEFNAIYVVGDLTGPIVLYGRGAGQMSAASAIVSDIIHLGQRIVRGAANGICAPWPGRKKGAGLKINCAKEMKSRCYMRFSVVDSPGVLAKISDILGRNGISIAQVIQKEEKKNNIVPVIMMTHEAVWENIGKALGRIDRLGIVKRKTVLIRVEE